MAAIAIAAIAIAGCGDEHEQTSPTAPTAFETPSAGYGNTAPGRTGQATGNFGNARTAPTGQNIERAIVNAPQDEVMFEGMESLRGRASEHLSERDILVLRHQ